ncbi:MAG: hypothetical protein Q9207_008120 [Kuettlingeria erythrocarpa]
MSPFDSTTWLVECWQRGFSRPFNPAASQANFHPANIPSCSVVGGVMARHRLHYRVVWSADAARETLLLTMDHYVFLKQERGIFWQDVRIEEDGSGWAVVFLRDGREALELQITVVGGGGSVGYMVDLEDGVLDERVLDERILDEEVLEERVLDKERVLDEGAGV